MEPVEQSVMGPMPPPGDKDDGERVLGMNQEDNFPTSSGVPSGVMDQGYIDERSRKPQLIFRYKLRALMVHGAAERFLKQTRELKLLDLGAAEGRTALEIDRLLPGGMIHGVEYATNIIAKNVSFPPNVKIFQGDVTALASDLEEGSYDIVSALALLEHLSNPVAAISEAHRMLRPGGIFVATCPNPFWDDVADKLGLLKGEHHECEMDRRSMIASVEQGGFEFVSFEPFMCAATGLLPYFRLGLEPSTAMKFDGLLRSLRVFNWSFVNQCVVGRKSA
jgi:SAM-dependent methyltransferase